VASAFAALGCSIVLAISVPSAQRLTVPQFAKDTVLVSAFVFFSHVCKCQERFHAKHASLFRGKSCCCQNLDVNLSPSVITAQHFILNQGSHLSQAFVQ
jgi:hypothetical protein